MATTVGNFTAIDDSEVDAESPITESLVTRLRDNAYWVNEGTTQTSQGTGDKLLQTDGAGGVEWIDKDTVGVDGTKGRGNATSTSSGSITKISDKILMITFVSRISSNSQIVGAGAIFIDTSDDTYAATGTSGTLTSSFTTVAQALVTSPTSSVQARITGGNYEVRTLASSSTVDYAYCYL